MNSVPFSGWVASLSNGETVLEQSPLPGEKSSWQKLLDRLEAESLKISQLRLFKNGVAVICDVHKKVEGYCMAYEMNQSVFRGTVERMQGAGSIINGLVFMTWIDDHGYVRQDIRELEEMKLHSTLRNAHDRNNNQQGTV